MAGEPSACRQGESASPNLSTPSERDPYYVFLRKRLIDGSYASGAPCAAAFTASGNTAARQPRKKRRSGPLSSIELTG